MADLFTKIRTAFEKLSERERRLAQMVGVLAVLFVGMVSVPMALGNLQDLNGNIASLQDTILNYTGQIAIKDSVNAQYAKVATQHSSEWDDKEISDRLKAEINRLAQKNPPGLRPDGTPVSMVGSGGVLVNIPGLGEAEFTPGGDGFRSYTIEVGIPNADIMDIIEYVKRLQGSPQSLRVDEFMVDRNPMTTLAHARMTITRIVIDSEGGELEGPESDTSGKG